jgi:hypothetical protein
MSLSEFERDPLGYAARYPLLVNERPILNLRPDTARDQHEMLDADDFQMFYDIVSMSSTRVFNITQNSPPGVRRLYFLPYVPDAATSMTLGDDCDFFLTSTLSGCSAQVFGSRDAPTVTHANAGDKFKKSFAREKDRLQRTVGLDDVESGEAADRKATTDVNARINRMLPDPGRHAPARLRKGDYMALYNARNFKKAKEDYVKEHKKDVHHGAGAGFKVHDINVSREAGRPQIGATVFGLRNFRGARGWTIFYQTSLAIVPEGKKRTGFLKMHASTNNLAPDEVVLGGVHQLFPPP